MSTKKRRRFTPEQKAEIVRRNLEKKEPVSEICEELGIQPSVFYGWRNQLFDNTAWALEAKAQRGRSGEKSAAEQAAARIAELESELAKKDSVIAHLAEECVSLKKGNGGS